ARGLQPERVGPHAGLRVLGAATATGPGLGSAHLGRGGARLPHRGLPRRQHARTDREGGRPLRPPARPHRPLPPAAPAMTPALNLPTKFVRQSAGVIGRPHRVSSAAGSNRACPSLSTSTPPLS